MRREHRITKSGTEDGVSNVIATILIVAIVVSLAAVVYLFVSGFFFPVEEPLAATSFSYEYEGGSQTLNIIYLSGPVIQDTFSTFPTNGLVLNMPMSTQSSIDPYKQGNPILGTISTQPYDFLSVSLDNYLSVPSDDELDLTTSGSIATWINPSALNSWMGIVHKGELKSFSDECYTLQVHSNPRQLFFGLFQEDNTHEGAYSSTQLSINTWYHVVGTWDMTKINLYVNDVLEDTKTNTLGAPQTSDGALQIGAQLTQVYNYHYMNFPFDGDIGPTYLYDRALTTDEIHGLYVGGSWNNIKITRNGIAIPIECVSTSATSNTLSSGDTITIQDPAFASGDVISIIYIPADQLLKTFTLGTSQT